MTDSFIPRYKGVVASLEDWEASERIIPEEIWALVVFTGTDDYPTSLGLKLGSGRRFADTPYIFSPQMLETRIPKPTTPTPSSNLFLAQDGIYYAINTGNGGCDLDCILSKLEEAGLEIPTKEEVAWIREQMYKKPAFLTFSSTSPFIGEVEMGSVIQGQLPLAWTVANSVNIKTTSIAVSEGAWTGTGAVAAPATSRSKVLSATAPITSNTIKTIVYTISGTDTKDNPIPAMTLRTVFTHRVHYGTADSRSITSLSEVTGLKSVRSNSRKHSLTFVPNGSQYPIILIPVEVDQQGINIVNANAPTVDHSYSMNEGDTGTTSAFTVLDRGILYNAYVGYNPSLGPSVATIK